MICSTVYFLTGNYFQMNSGLPSLLDAIYGKKDLASVSLDEMYEVISEFPSFNAAHLLLSKKLKLQDDAAFLKENTRTALYFNNAFWLQTLLDDGLPAGQAEISVSPEAIKTNGEATTGLKEGPAPFEEEIPVEEKNFVQEPVPSDPVEPAAENTPEGIHAGTAYISTEPNIVEEEEPRTVTSFDELMSKYKIEPDQTGFEPVAEDENADKTEHETPVLLETEYDAGADASVDPAEETHTGEKADDVIPEAVQTSNTDLFETREEVLNDYGIFEEVQVKKSDQDLDDFDPPEDERTEDIVSIEIPKPVTQPVAELYITEQSPEISVDRDYEAFDRPLETIEDTPIREEQVPDPESSDEARDADDTEHNEDQMVHYAEEQKAMVSFDPKKTESIVFAPYHMIDYFASQGIKLVQEDQPADHFGRQLKSFTDWLKVMKRLPVQPGSEKTDEREADRIRHFAAHSIEERDVLTESMAEVLAKQGMYENAIALYHKLSLIYPPKSAYFASRIEQLKASLP
jgi:hypothetical protein